jgi:hypothetical protein
MGSLTGWCRALGAAALSAVVDNRSSIGLSAASASLHPSKRFLMPARWVAKVLESGSKAHLFRQPAGCLNVSLPYCGGRERARSASPGRHG